MSSDKMEKMTTFKDKCIAPIINGNSIEKCNCIIHKNNKYFCKKHANTLEIILVNTYAKFKYIPEDIPEIIKQKIINVINYIDNDIPSNNKYNFISDENKKLLKELSGINYNKSRKEDIIFTKEQIEKIEKVKEMARRGTEQEKIHAKKILLDKFNITI